MLTDCVRLGDRTLNGMWQIDVAPASDPLTGVRRVYGEFEGTSVREVETRCRFGKSIPLGPYCRPAGAKPVVGWFGVGKLTTLLAKGTHADVIVDVDTCPTRDVRLSMTALAASPAGGAQRVRVMVNGEPVGELTFPPDQVTEQNLVFAGATLNRHSPARLAFEFPDGSSYHGGSTTYPKLRFSIRLDEMKLTPVSP